jgi:hypothetical protein
MLTALAIGHIGFFGQSGPLWVFLGFVCLCVVVAILFKIVFLALPPLGVKEPWISVIYWVMVLIAFLWFLNYAFGWGS